MLKVQKLLSDYPFLLQHWPLLLENALMYSGVGYGPHENGSDVAITHIQRTIDHMGISIEGKSWLHQYSTATQASCVVVCENGESLLAQDYETALPHPVIPENMYKREIILLADTSKCPPY